MDRWVEHYNELYSSETNAISSTLNGIESLSSMDELDVEPTLGELNNAIDSLVHGKALDNDRFPPDLIKCCRSTLLHPLHEILFQ